tara:strand:- start:13476 stop:14504 length:1029 start_codon:yes stop_codon:yes gene_type:complete
MSWTAVAIGMGALNFVSSRNSARDQNRAMARMEELERKKFRYNWEEGQDAYAFAVEGIDIQRHNDDLMREWQDGTAINQWIDKNELRIFDYNNMTAAYNASLDRFETQLDYNNLAQEIAINDNTRKYNERLTEMGFKYEDITMNLGFETRKLMEQIGAKRDVAAGKGEDAKIQTLAKKGQALNLGQSGRTAEKNIHAVLVEGTRTQQALVDMITRDNSMYGMSMQEAYAGFEFGERQLVESMKSASGQYAADIQKIDMEKWQADLAAEDRIAPKPVLAPELSKPLQLPTMKYQYPDAPRSWEEMQHLMPVEGARADTFLGPLMSGINTGFNAFGGFKSAGLF